MKEKIKNAVDILKNMSSNVEKTIRFEHFASSQDKSVKGEVKLSKQGTISFHLTDITGYNSGYINKTANSFFRHAILSEIELNSILWTKHKGSNYDLGDIYTIPSGTYYYGVGENAFLTCNGTVLFQNVEAEYLGMKPGSCAPGIGGDYTRFKIVEL